MITYGYAKEYQYTGDGTLKIKVRIPSVHGPYNMRDYGGKQVRNYVYDEDLPWISSILLPHLPQEGEVVAIASFDTGSSDFIVIGLTGGSYQSGAVNFGE